MQPRYGLCNEHFTDRSLAATAELAAELGYDGLEITPWTAVDSPATATVGDAMDVREAVASASLEVIGIPRVFDATDTEYHVGHPDEAVRGRTVAHLRSVVDLCAAVGGSVVLFGSPVQRTVPTGIDHAEAWHNALDSFRDPDLLARLEAAEVDLCMEPISPPHTDFVTTTSEAVRFAEAVAHPNVGVALDGYHLAREERPAADCVRDAGGLLRHVHCDGATGRGPAEGTLDYRPILDALADVDYDGYLSLELHEFLFADEPDVDPVDAAASTLEYFRRIA